MCVYVVTDCDIILKIEFLTYNKLRIYKIVKVNIETGKGIQQKFLQFSLYLRLYFNCWVYLCVCMCVRVNFTVNL